MRTLLVLAGLAGCTHLPPEKGPPPGGGPDDTAGDETGCVSVWSYADADGDGFGDAAAGVEACEVPAGHVANDDDCDDDDPAVRPGGEDACGDDIDGDCNGVDPLCDLSGTFPLTDATAKLYSTNANYDAGRNLDVGDINGDGFDDIVIATVFAEGLIGGGYVVYGPVSGTSDLDTAGVHVTGDAVAGGGGRAVGVADVDGDGLEDVGFGAPYGSENGLYVLRGPLTGDVALSSADAVLLGEYGVYCGHGADVADVNGDGFGDGLVGCYATGAGEGTLYVKFGPLDGPVDLVTEADATLVGEAPGVVAGRLVRAGEDVDGDGIGDIAQPGPYASAGGPDSGLVYVVYGPPTDLDLADADGRLIGEGPNAAAGSAVAMADVNGDGLADIVVGSMDGTAARQAGAAYVVYGPAAGDLALGAADVILRGERVDQLAGNAVTAGDVDGDGAAEVLVGAIGDERWAGTAYLFLSPAPGTWVMTDAEVHIPGEDEGDYAGQGVALGDIDGNGHRDAVIGAPYEATGGSQAGAVYVVGF